MRMFGLEVGTVGALILSVNLACVSSPVPEPVAVKEPVAAEAAERCPAGANACEALFAPARKLPTTPADRFESRLDTMQGELSSLDNKLDLGDIEMSAERKQEVAKAFAAENVRGSALQLQELQLLSAEMYKDGGNDKARDLILGQHERTNAFESAIGEYNRRQETLERTENSTVLAKADPGIIEDIKSRAGHEARDEMLSKLRSLGWLTAPSRKIEEMRSEIRGLETKSLKKDQRAFVKAMGKRIELMMKKIEDVRELIEKDHYATHELDDGLHYFRRRLREISLMFGTADGIFKFTTKDLTDEQKAELEKLRPYARTDWENLPAFENAIEIPVYYVLKLEYLVGKLGELKDFKEAQLDTKEVIVQRELARRNGQKLKKKELARIEEEAESLAFDAMVEFFTQRNAKNEKKRSGRKMMTIPDPRRPKTSVEEQTQGYYKDATDDGFLKSLRKELGKGYKSLKHAQ